MELNRLLVITGNNSSRRLIQKDLVSSLKASNQSNPKSGGTTLVLVTPKSTSTQAKFMKGTITTGTMETQKKSTHQNYQTSTFWLEDSLAKLSAWLENEQDLTTPEAHSFLTSLGFSKKKNHDIWYSKTSKVYLLTTKEELSRQYLGFLPTWGIELNGKYLTAKTSEFPRTESECLLSDILEENVDEKYFLSEESLEKILPKISYTIDANYHKGTNVEQYKKKKRRQIVSDGLRVRRLTPKECERLQGFPDDWTAGESDTQRYKMCGNAVTTNVVQAVMEGLLDEED